MRCWYFQRVIPWLRASFCQLSGGVPGLTASKMEGPIKENSRNKYKISDLEILSVYYGRFKDLIEGNGTEN